jgi:enoyl-CoA hydratase/3-hydroxyacyl-CoA dehydrogenase
VLIATPKSSMAFPETGIGIYPGLGGTQRTTRRVGVGLAKWLVFTGKMLRAHEAKAIGLVDELVPHEDLDSAVRRAALGDVPRERTRTPLPESFRALAEIFAASDADALREGRTPMPADENLARAVKAVAGKAPIALRLAGRLIEEGSQRPLAEGLRMELDHLVEIFGTRDAYEGLSTLGKRAPVFEGR